MDRRVYIRHGEKAYDNNLKREYGLDPPLTPSGKEAALALAQELISKYGHPARIVSSPFLRCRETAAALAQVAGIPDVELDRELGEYLGNKTVSTLEGLVRAETLAAQPYINETFSQLCKRALSHTQGQRPSSCWYVSHGLVISRIAKAEGINLASPGYLGYHLSPAS